MSKTARIKLRSYDATELKNVVNNVMQICKAKGVKCTKVPLPTKKTIFSILQSPFIYKTSQKPICRVQKSILLTLFFNEDQNLEVIASSLLIPSSISVEMMEDKLNKI